MMVAQTVEVELRRYTVDDIAAARPGATGSLHCLVETTKCSKALLYRVSEPKDWYPLFLEAL